MSHVAAIQLNSGPNIQANMLVVGDLLKEISKTNAKIVVLPENFALMPENDREFLEHSESQGNGIIQNLISDYCKQYKLWVVAGTIPIKTDNAHKVRAATFIFNDVGDIVCRYDKIHLFDVRLPDSDESYNESEIFEFGDKIQVIETPIGITGLGCCYDLRFPELFRQ